MICNAPLFMEGWKLQSKMRNRSFWHQISESNSDIRIKSNRNKQTNNIFCVLAIPRSQVTYSGLSKDHALRATDIDKAVILIYKKGTASISCKNNIEKHNLLAAKHLICFPTIPKRLVEGRHCYDSLLDILVGENRSFSETFLTSTRWKPWTCSTER